MYTSVFPKNKYWDKFEGKDMSAENRDFLADICEMADKYLNVPQWNIERAIAKFKGVYMIDKVDDPSTKAYLQEDAIYLLKDGKEDRYLERLAHETLHLLSHKGSTQQASPSEEIMTQGFAFEMLQGLSVPVTTKFELENFCNNPELSITGPCCGFGYNTRNSAWPLLKSHYGLEDLTRYYFMGEPLPEEMLADGLSYMNKALTANIYYEPAYRDKKLLELANMELGYDTLTWSDIRPRSISGFLNCMYDRTKNLPTLTIDGTRIYPKSPLVNSSLIAIAACQGADMEQVKGLFSNDPCPEAWDLTKAMIAFSMAFPPNSLGDAEYAIRDDIVYVGQKNWKTIYCISIKDNALQVDTEYGLVPENPNRYFTYQYLENDRVNRKRLPSDLEWKKIEITPELLSKSQPEMSLKEVIDNDLSIYYLIASTFERGSEDKVKYSIAINSRLSTVSKDVRISKELLEEILDAGLMEPWSFNYKIDNVSFDKELPSGRHLLQVALESPEKEFPFRVLRFYAEGKSSFGALVLPKGIDINMKGSYNGVEMNLLEYYLEVEPEKYYVIDWAMRMGTDLTTDSGNWTIANSIANTKNLNLIALALSRGITMEQLFYRPNGAKVNDLLDRIEEVSVIDDSHYMYIEDGKIKTADIPKDIKENVIDGLAILGIELSRKIEKEEIEL